jgi:hypothetical protein
MKESKLKDFDYWMYVRRRVIWWVSVASYAGSEAFFDRTPGSSA